MSNMMTKITTLAAVLLLASCSSVNPPTPGDDMSASAAPSAPEAPAAPEAPVTPEAPEAPMSNDIETVLMAVDNDPIVSVRVVFMTGAMHDPAGKEGLAQITASAMAQGATMNRSYPEILSALYPMATSYNVRVDKEMTTFIGRAHVETIDEFAALMLEAILEPAFTEADIERLKAQTLTQISKQLRYSSDEELGKAVLYNDIFEGTGYGHLNSGTVAAVESITVDDVKAFYAAQFTVDRVTLGLGGGFDDSVVETFQSALSRLPEGASETSAAISPAEIDGRQVTIVAKPGQSTAISFGFPFDVHRGDADYYALWVANSWLGEHRNSSSHLYQVIREIRGLNYGDYSYVEHFPNGGGRQMPPANVGRSQQIFEVWIRPVPDPTAHFSLRAAMRELETLIDNGMSAEDFETTRKFLSKYHLHFAPTTSAKLGYRLDDRFYGIGGEGHLARFKAELETMTLERVNTALKRHLDPANMRIAIVTADAEGLAEKLASETPSPIEYATPKDDSVHEEDKVISVYPLGIAAENITIVPVDELFAN